MFNCFYLSKDFEFNELVELFYILDNKQDGTLDQTEFNQLFNGVKDTWNSHNHNILNSILRDKEGIKLQKDTIDINQAYNTIDKFCPAKKDLLNYPYYSK